MSAAWKRGQDGVLEQSLAEALAFFPQIDGQAGQDHQGNRVFADPLAEGGWSIGLGRRAIGQ